MARDLRSSRRCFLVGTAAATSSLGLASTGLADTAELAVIVNEQNKERLSPSDLEQIYRATRRYWADGKSIVALNLTPGSLERVQFDQAVLRLGPQEVSRYWIDRKIRGGEPAPRSVPNPSLVARLVQQLATGVGYVPTSQVLSGTRVVARVRGRDVVVAGSLLRDTMELV